MKNMKEASRNKQINTIPNGVWESSRPITKKSKKEKKNEITTDLQGNGYPVNKYSNQSNSRD